jgi:type IV pilus assembly protein PilM
MLSFVQSWFTPGANPVGVDFGTDCLRLAQVEKNRGEFRLVAAASAVVPHDIRHDSAARLSFFTRSLRELWTRGNFRGRQAALALPAASMYIQHLRLPRMDEATLKRAIPWEAQGKLPIEPSEALIRHLVAGDIYADDQPRSEVIVMAARGAFIEQFLAAAAKGRVEVMAMPVEPKAMVDCFLNIYRRETDTNATNCFVDMGCSATRVTIVHGSQILFARSIPIGGQRFSQAVGDSGRVEHARAGDARTEARLFAGAGAANSATCVASSASERRTDTCDEWKLEGRGCPQERRRAGADLGPPSGDEELNPALEEPLHRLSEELTLCRRYHESTFPQRPVQRLVFVGGGAGNRTLCQNIAKEMGIGAMIGDPLVRMGRNTEVTIESGIDRRVPQPAWTVAIGLSMGIPVADAPARQ